MGIVAFFYKRDCYTFFGHTIIIEFGKNADSTDDSMLDTIIPFIRFCVATIGVCVFQCADFGWRTFCF